MSINKPGWKYIYTYSGKKTGRKHINVITFIFGCKYIFFSYFYIFQNFQNELGFLL